MLGLREEDGHGPYFFEQIIHSSVFVAIFWFAYREISIAMRKKYPRHEDTMKRLTIVGVIVLLTAPIMKAVLSYLTEIVMCSFSLIDHSVPNTPDILVRIYIPSFLIISIYECVYFFVRYRRSVIEKERIQTAHVQTQLDNLRNQINPHFLFNGLNTLMNLIPLDQDKAMTYLSKLSKFYRYTVGSQEEKLIPLDKEKKCAYLYSDLLTTRFGEALKVNCNLPTNTLYSILPMSLQMLIENAVKHNIVSKSHPLEININLNESDQVVTVSNNIQKKLESVSSTGMGLENIKQRFSFFTKTPVLITETDHVFMVSLPLIKHNQKT